MKEGILPVFLEAFRLILDPGSGIYPIILRSLIISGIALILSSLAAIPLGCWVGLHHFRGKKILVTLFNTCMAVPTTTVGLVVYLLLSRSGPAGVLGLLFTPVAMIIAQMILATPILCALSVAAVSGVDRSLVEAAVTMGASRFQTIWLALQQTRAAILTALMAGFARIISEVGAAMIVGGNIKGSTRVMSTAIISEVRMGNFEFALSLGIVLFLVAFLVNGLVYRLK